MKKTFLGLVGLLTMMGTSAKAADAPIFTPSSSSYSMSLDLNQSSIAPILSISYQNTGGKGSMAPVLSGAGFSILSNRCLSVAQNRSCVVSVIMNTRIAGSYSATIKSANGSDVAISGSVTAKSVSQVPSFSISPATQSVSFASGEKNKIVHVSVKNTGAINSTPSLSIATNSSGLTLLLNRCVGGIRPGASCDVSYSVLNKLGTSSIAEALGQSASIVVAAPAPAITETTNFDCATGNPCFKDQVGYMGSTSNTDRYINGHGGNFLMRLYHSDQAQYDAGVVNEFTPFDGQGIGFHLNSHGDLNCTNGGPITVIRHDGGIVHQVSPQIARIFSIELDPMKDVEAQGFDVACTPPYLAPVNQDDLTCSDPNFCWPEYQGWNGSTSYISRIYVVQTAGNVPALNLYRFNQPYNAGDDNGMLLSIRPQSNGNGGENLFYQSHMDMTCRNGGEIVLNSRNDGGPVYRVDKFTLRVKWLEMNPRGVDNASDSNPMIIDYTCKGS